MKQVFISYASEDDPLATQVEDFLRANGMHTWRDKTRLSGDDTIAAKIQEALRQSGWVVILFSKRALRSEWVMLKESLWAASSHRKKTVGVLLDDIDVELLPQWIARNHCPRWSDVNAKASLLKSLLADATMYEEQMSLARSHYNSTEFAIAERHLRKAIDASGDNAERRAVALRFRSQVFDQKNERNRALEDITEALKLDPQSIDAWVTRAHYFADKKEWINAYKDLDSALKINQASSLALGDRGTYRLQEARDRRRKKVRRSEWQALVHMSIKDLLQSVADVNVQDGTDITVRYLSELGRAYEMTDKLADSEVQLRRAIDIRPTAAMPRYLLGYVLHRRGEIDDAITNYEQAVDSIGDPECAFCLGYAYYSNGFASPKKTARASFQNAIRRFTQVLAVRPEVREGLRVNALVGRGRSHVMLGDHDSGLHDADAALALAPKDKRAHLLKAWVAKQRGEIAEAVRRAEMLISHCGECVMARALIFQSVESKNDSAKAKARDDLSKAAGAGFIELLIGKRRQHEPFMHLSKEPPAALIGLNSVDGESPCKRHRYSCEVNCCIGGQSVLRPRD